MGRPRKRDAHLLPYVRLKHGAYWYIKIVPNVRFGSTLPEAMARYYEIVDAPTVASTMGSVFDRYGLDVLPRKGPETQRKYRASLVLLRAFFGPMAPADVRPRHVYQYLDTRGADAPVAANRDVATLSDVFAHAMRWGAVDINPCIGVHRHSERPRDRAVSDAELATWCAHASPMIRGYTVLKHLTGMHQQDLLALTDQQITASGIAYGVLKSARRDRSGRQASPRRMLIE